MDLISIKEEVTLNKQRAIPFSYTGEVVDFLLASIEGLSKENERYSALLKAAKRLGSCSSWTMGECLAKVEAEVQALAEKE